jgi:hypothetical protein
MSATPVSPPLSPSSGVRIAYAAHTDAGTFLLDSEGICRGFVPSPDQSGSFRVRAEAADRCIGAQYVAAIDVTEPGALIPLPRIGAALLLGIVDANGRISLVRTGPVVRFEPLEPEARAEGPRGHGKESEIRLDIDWDDESTAAAPLSKPAESRLPDRSSEPTTVRVRLTGSRR